MTITPAQMAVDVVAMAAILVVLLGLAEVIAGAMWVISRARCDKTQPRTQWAPPPPPTYAAIPEMPPAPSQSPWTRPTPPTPPAAPTHQTAVRPVDLAPPHRDAEAAAQRAALLTGFVQLRALLLDDDLSAGLLTDTLRRGGVTVVDPVGNRLDPRRHRVDHTVSAPEPRLDGLIAETLSPCYLDGDRVLAPADVVVYRWARL